MTSAMRGEAFAFELVAVARGLFGYLLVGVCAEEGVLPVFWPEA